MSALNTYGLTRDDFATLLPATQRAIIQLDHAHALADDIEYTRASELRVGCHECGRAFADAEAICRNPKCSANAEAMDEESCEECGEPVPDGDTLCGDCNSMTSAQLADRESPPEAAPLNNCAACDAVIYADEILCERCDAMASAELEADRFERNDEETDARSGAHRLEDGEESCALCGEFGWSPECDAARDEREAARQGACEGADCCRDEMGE